MPTGSSSNPPPARGFAPAVEVRPRSRRRRHPSILKRQLLRARLGIEWNDVMAFGVHSDRVVIIEGPVGFKRTWWFPEARAQAVAEG